MAVLPVRNPVVSMVILLYITSSRVANSGHIVIITSPLYSVIIPLIPTIDELFHKYGHRTTVIMPSFLAETPMVKNSTIDVVISKKLDALDFSALMSDTMETALKGKSPWGLGYLQLLKQLCDLYLSDADLFQELKIRPIKLAVVSNAAFGMCLNIIAYKLSVPFMQYGQSYDPINDRIPYSASFVPAYPIVTFSDKMNLFERIINLLLFSSYTLVQDMCSPFRAVEKYAPEKPYISTTDLWKQAEFHLLEFDVLMDYPRPVFPNYAFIGGIGTNPAQPLKAFFQDFIESDTKVAVVVVSFGSMATGFPDYINNKLIESYKRLGQVKFIFKHGERSYIKDNILYSPWLPQNDLLGHPNTRLFITHCGNGGQYEALYHGIPMIGFPLFSEQHSNARRMEERGFGIAMKIYDFTVDELVHNINEGLSNKGYKTAISKASEIFRSRPDTPNQRMAYWIDHVMKYGGKYMRPTSLDIPLYQYLMLDVFFVYLALIFLLICCLKFFCVLCVAKLRKFKTKVE